MQLSSRTKDYIVDTLALRQHLGPALIGIFANPDIVKVGHLENCRMFVGEVGPQMTVSSAVSLCQITRP
jgi:hypothetical protein